MKKVSLLGLALIAIGLLALVFNYSDQSVFTFFSGNTVEINEREVVDGTPITDFDIYSTSTNVYVIPHDQEEISIELSGRVSDKLKNSFKLDVQTNGSKLGIKVERENQTVKNIFGTIVLNTKLEVYVPEKMYEAINVNTSSGKITIEDVQAKDLEINASSGKIIVSNVIAENALQLQTSSGRIEALNNQATSLQAKASSGAITINEIQASSMTITTSSGKIEIINSVGEITAAASSGSISIDNKQLSGDITAATSSGRVEIQFKETPSVTVDFKGSSGKGNVAIPEMVYEENKDNYIYGKVGSGDYTINVRTSSGGFQLN